MLKNRIFRYGLLLFIIIAVFIEGTWLYGKFHKSNYQPQYQITENHDPMVVINQDHPPKGHGKWFVDDDQSSMDDSKGVDAYVPAEESVEAWLKHPMPVLHIRCMEKRTDVYVIAGTATNPELGLFNKYHVRLRLDKNKPLTQIWTGATDNETLFAPKPVELARMIARSDSMAFEFTPFNASPVIARFDVRGLNAHLPRIAKACGWRAA